MSLLVVGSELHATGFFESIAQQTDQYVDFCSDSEEVRSFFREGTRKVDWIILDGLPKAEVDKMMQTLDSEGIDVPVVQCQKGKSTDQSRMEPVLVGAFKRSAQGLRLLGCNLAMPGEDATRWEAPFSEEILYEYHAPCRR